MLKLIEFLLGYRIAVIYGRGKSNYKGLKSNNNVCPFCNKDQEGYLQVYDHWVLLRNEYPYPRHKHHWLLVPRRHIERRSDLIPSEAMEFMRIKSWLCGERNMISMGRQYPSAESSVPHLHEHFISHEIE